MTNTNNKILRELETRAVTERPTHWQQPELLPNPDRQEGYAYRWIRVSTLNNADPRNLSAKLREGWEAVKSEEQPQLAMLADPNSRFKDNIEIGGLLLCKTPKEFVEQRNTHFDNLSKSQTESVDNNIMRQSDPRMPLFTERKSSTSFGKGN
jgi:hypothetical protein